MTWALIASGLIVLVAEIKPFLAAKHKDWPTIVLTFTITCLAISLGVAFELHIITLPSIAHLLNTNLKHLLPSFFAFMKV